MEEADSTRASPNSRAEMPQCFDERAPVNEDRAGREENGVVRSRSFIAGVIVDSWVENALPDDGGAWRGLASSPARAPRGIGHRRSRRLGGLRPRFAGGPE